MLRSAIVTLAAIVAFAPAAAMAESHSLTCMVAGKPMKIAYDGGPMEGTVMAQTPWGNFEFPHSTYAGGAPYGEFVFSAAASSDSVIMPDLDRLMTCLKSYEKAPDDLLDWAILSIYMEACVPVVPEGKAVPALFEVSVSVTADYGVDVSVFRTYAAKAPVAGDQLAIVTNPKPECAVDPQ